MAQVRVPSGLPKDKIEQMVSDIKTNPVRPLTVEERKIYSRAITRAHIFIPAFRDALALLRPYMDATNQTAYVDRYSRVALSYWFLYTLTEEQQASVILHESMHVLNNHIARGELVASKSTTQTELNLAGDMEINTVLTRVDFVDLREAVYPEKSPYKFPVMQTMERYLGWLLDKKKEEEANCPVHGKASKDKSEEGGPSEDTTNGQNSSESQTAGEAQAKEGSQPGATEGDSGEEVSGENQNGSGSGSSTCTCHKGQEEAENGKAWSCDPSTEGKETQADEAGIQRASEVEQNIAKVNTAARILEERNKGGQGFGHMDEFWDVILRNLMPKKVDWRKILRSLLAQVTDAIARGRSDYTYRRPSRRFSDSEFIFPGMVTYLPKAMWGIDTSGSMGNEDYQRLLNEINGIIKTFMRGKDSLKLFSVDTKVSGIRPVTSLNNLRLSGGGGTQMAKAWQYVNSLPKKQQPDLFILSTDGFIDWNDVEREVRGSKFRSIILVTQHSGFLSAPESLRKLIPTIDISDDKK